MRTFRWSSSSSEQFVDLYVPFKQEAKHSSLGVTEYLFYAVVGVTVLCNGSVKIIIFFPPCWPTYSTSVISRSVTWLFRGSFSSILMSVKIRSIERLHDRIIVKRFSFEGPAWSKAQTATFCTDVLHGRYHRPRMENHWHRHSFSVAPVICVQVYKWIQFFALNFVKHTWLWNSENCGVMSASCAVQNWQLPRTWCVDLYLKNQTKREGYKEWGRVNENKERRVKVRFLVSNDSKA